MPMSRLLQSLLLTLVLILTSPVSGSTAHAAPAKEAALVAEPVPVGQRSDGLYAPQQQKSGQAVISEQQNCRLSLPRLHDYLPTTGPRPTSTDGRVPDYAKFNPYNLISHGWLRRQLTASHPHAQGRYYVYALRHILR